MTPDESEPTPPPERGTVEVELHPQPGVAVVAVRGEHDLRTKAELAEALERASAHPHVLVDLSECSFMDSLVIGALVVASKRLEERDGRLEVVIAPEAHTVHRLAELTRLATFLPIHAARSAPSPASNPRSDGGSNEEPVGVRAGRPGVHAPHPYAWPKSWPRIPRRRLVERCAPSSTSWGSKHVTCDCSGHSRATR
jgi:anti-anti-sigma factor